MKKKIACILVAIMALASLVACGGSASGETLVMATSADFPPFQYYEGDQIVGLDVDIAKAIVDKLGMELEIEDMSFDAIIPAIQAGRADFAMAAMTVTEERMTQVDFSVSYYTGRQVVIVSEDNSDINTPDDLEGMSIGVQIGTTGDILSSWEFGDENIQRFTRGMEAVQALAQGSVDAVIIDDYPAHEFVNAVSGLRILPAEWLEEDYAIAFPQGSELVDKFNAAIEELKANGTFQEIVDRHIGTGTD
ncbi:MAG: basic amino acid ABC transporter substrate-binding protein [Lachnospiraceae bacterium]|nr:basic amino acid ABC transporter substrate-binding protein [Lachnospiraceae bacterium]